MLQTKGKFVNCHATVFCIYVIQKGVLKYRNIGIVFLLNFLLVVWLTQIRDKQYYPNYIGINALFRSRDALLKYHTILGIKQWALLNYAKALGGGRIAKTYSSNFSQMLAKWNWHSGSVKHALVQ